MTFRLSQRSKDRLQGVHPDLVAVMELAIKRTPVDFTVLEGLRTEERQRKLYASGASKTLNSRHLTGHAVDVAPYADGEISWHWPHYYPLAATIKDCAYEIGVKIEWGGDWTSLRDGPHWQLPWSEYGKTDMQPRHKAAQQPPKPDWAPAPHAEAKGLWAALIAALAAIFGRDKA